MESTRPDTAYRTDAGGETEIKTGSLRAFFAAACDAVMAPGDSMAEAEASELARTIRSQFDDDTCKYALWVATFVLTLCQS